MTDSRDFLRGLASLPLIGGGVTILGNPTAAAVPVTPHLMQSYLTWLEYEHRMTAFEMAGHQIEASKEIRKQVWFDTPGGEFHWQWSDGRYYGPAGWAGAPQPSTRAAIVLSAVGCSVTEDDAP